MRDTAFFVIDPARLAVPYVSGRPPRTMADPEAGLGVGVYGHHWYVDPVNRLTVIALTNTALEGMVGGFVGELMEAVYHA